MPFDENRKCSLCSCPSPNSDVCSECESYNDGYQDGIEAINYSIKSIIVNGDLTEEHWEWWRDSLKSLIGVEKENKPDRYDIICKRLEDLCFRVKELENP